ncbi:hypothetical protein M124_2618 [Bacteroides fragilis str. 3988T(B)14]|uniref:Uncharacterized protein n=1 Tax=Bacteroides fragilis str. 3988T(B)14 TaxID=1339315 RepID=A0A015UHQ1_BACFG|nr:hypothetical protein M124_2618 [Bacteroides fragilis str. 3988T(B)14]
MICCNILVNGGYMGVFFRNVVAKKRNSIKVSPNAAPT